VNYNFDKGWYLTFSPIITANWEAASGQEWTVPLGGGIGKIFKIGSQVMNAQVHNYHNYHNVEMPDFIGDQAAVFGKRYLLVFLSSRRFFKVNKRLPCLQCCLSTYLARNGKNSGSTCITLIEV
jgi:hypothetical protein